MGRTWGKKLCKEVSRERPGPLGYGAGDPSLPSLPPTVREVAPVQTSGELRLCPGPEGVALMGRPESQRDLPRCCPCLSSDCSPRVPQKENWGCSEVRT